MRRVGSDLAYAANGARPGHHRQVEQIFAFAAEHFVGVGQHAGRHDIDDDFAGAEHRIGEGFDGERRSERLQDGSFHGHGSVEGSAILAGLFRTMKAWYYPRIIQSPSGPGGRPWRTRDASNSAISSD